MILPDWDRVTELSKNVALLFPHVRIIACDIAITDDATAEPAESFTVTLSNVSVATLGANSSATVNIIDDD